MPGSQMAFYGNISVGGGPAPVRAYIEELPPDILDGRIEPGKVFDCRPRGRAGQLPCNGRPRVDQGHGAAMTAARWTSSELDRIGASEELEIAPARHGGTLRPSTPIWVVRVGDELYVRSWRGAKGAWFRAARASRRRHLSAGGVEKDVTFVDAGGEVNDYVDTAYREKYRRYASYVPPMVAAQARAATLRLVAEEAHETMSPPRRADADDHPRRRER